MTNRYSVTIMPSGNTALQVKKIKTELKNIIDKYPGWSADTHITLFDFEADEFKLNIFDRKTQLVCNTVEPFTITCKNFDNFYWNKTIYVALDEDSKTKITQFRKKLSAELKHGKYDQEVNFDSGKNPHITIGRTLSEEQYKTAQKYFFKKGFAGSFVCDGIYLRRLITGENYTKYEVVKKYDLAKQNLSLF